MKKKIIQIILAIVSIYVFMMVLLLAVESLQGVEGGITNMGDAAWYLLATLTTVGYGDVTPATGAGKIIGAIMMLSSAGALTFLLGLIFSLFFGRLLPRFTLWRYRRREWYIFTCMDERSRFLAKQLTRNGSGTVFIFCSSDANQADDFLSDLPCHVVIDAPVSLVLKRHIKGGTSHVFCMGSDPWANYDTALSINNSDAATRNDLHIYCETSFTPEHLPDGMVLFNLRDNTARSYWMDNPIRSDEKLIVMIGEGELPGRLLERGLLINVFPDDHKMEYHIFGDNGNFLKDHYELHKILGINELSQTDDSLFFEENNWNTSSELLLNADRIILCDDNPSCNLSNMARLLKYFPVSGKLYICASVNDDRCTVFGSNSQTLNRHMVMKDSLNRVAMTMNDLYCAKSGGGQRWGELSEFHRQSNIAVADHLLTKIRLLLKDDDLTEINEENCRKAFKCFSSFDKEQREACRILEHKRWMRFHILYNWKYDPKRNNKLRHHHLLVAYDDLSAEEKALDDYAWEILGELK